MSRSGLSEGEDCDDFQEYRDHVSRQAVAPEGQRVFRALIAALDAMETKELHSTVLVTKSGCCCAMGAMLVHQGKESEYVQEDPDKSVDYWEEEYTDDPDYHIECMSVDLSAPVELVREIVWENDERSFHSEAKDWSCSEEQARWRFMREWAASNVLDASAKAGGEG